MADSYYDEYSDLLIADTPRGDADAETWSQIDPLGDLLFGWGDRSRNRAIQERQSKIRALQGKISAAQRKRLEEAINANSADWNRLTSQILGPSGTKMHDFYQGVQAEEQRNYDQYKQALGNYQGLESLFNNPNFYGDVGDVVNQARPTDATVQSQREALAQMKAQSTAQETAQERFQRLMAQQQAEANMKGARDSIAQDLKARGVYGSGAEIAQNMMAQADAANRRYMANLAANAQAQQRATQMLGMGADLAGKMRASETQEGQFANQVNMFNNQLNQNLMNTRSGAQLQSRDRDNIETGRRATSLYQAGSDLTGRKRGDYNTETDRTIGLTRGGMDTRMGGVNALNVFDDKILGQGNDQLGVLESQKETPWLGGGIG